MAGSFTFRCRLFTGLLALCGGTALADAPDGGALVRLRPQVEVGHARIVLRDVAEIIDANRQRAEELAELDLAVLDGNADLELDLAFVRVRILLAGMDRDLVRVVGADKTRITAGQPIPLTDLGIERAVQRSLCEQFDVPSEDLHVRLVSPFLSGALSRPEELPHARVEVVRAAQLPLGRCQLMVRLLDGERVAVARMASFEVTRRQNVVVALASLDRSHVVTASHVRQENRFVSTATDQLTADQVVGRKVQLPIRPGDVMTLRHVAEEISPDAPVLVNARDAVRLIAKKKGLTVTVPLAEALQSGRAGQLIKVRNMESNRIITGRVVGPGEVEIPLQ